MKLKSNETPLISEPSGLERLGHDHAYSISTFMPIATVNMAPVVLITGCNTAGIGACLAAAFQARGCIVYASDMEMGNMEGLPAGIHKLRLDVTDPASIKAAVEKVIKEQDHIDILINNAGVAGEFCPLADADPDMVKLAFDVNVHGLMAVTRAVVPYMASRRQGKIVNMGSVMSYVAHPIAGVYCATKFAVRSISDTLRVELAPFNIKVMLVAPGLIETPIWRKGLEAMHVDRLMVHAEQAPVIKKVGLKLVKKRKTPPEELARQVADQVLRSSMLRTFWYGEVSQMLWLLSWFPGWVSDWVLAKQFKFNWPLKALKLKPE